MTLKQLSRWNPSGGAYATFTLKLNGTVTPVTPTCNVKDFDEKVTLPSVMRSDLMSGGVGRYDGVSKEFVIALECEHKPKINIQFDGNKMTSIPTEDVLQNSEPGNENVGFQILYNNNPLKIGTVIKNVMTSTQTNEVLKFKAHYYYKGGDVVTGPVKTQAEFLMSYN